MVQYKKIALMLSVILVFQETSAFNTPYKSQCKQDQVLNECLFKNKKNGVFLEIGAYDGVFCSNTYYFEKELGWTGICFEPIPSVYEALKQNRSCICINACVSKAAGEVPFVLVKSPHEIDMLSGMLETYDPRHMARMQKETTEAGGSYSVVTVKSVNLNEILEEHSIINIDYLSLDIEGGELDVLKTIDFKRFKISAMSVENNYRDPAIRRFLESQGFVFITAFGGFDELYVHRNSMINFSSIPHALLS